MVRFMDNSKEIEMPKKNTLLALYSVAAKPWSVLFSCWSIVVFSIFFSWELPASGAVLVCGAVLAELLYQRQRWTKMNTDPSGGFDLIADLSNGKPIITGQFSIAPAGTGKLGSLLSLAIETELKSNQQGSQIHWFYTDTVRRIESYVATAVAVSAILGTILWGYGHLLF
jgi:hypothetical protein